MELKDLGAACEVVRGLSHSPEVITVMGSGSMDFPTIQLTEEFFTEKFGNILLEPFNEDYDQRRVRWSGCELFCLVKR